MIYDRIKELCAKNGITVNKLEAELGIGRGSLCKIDKHKPSSEKMQKIAQRLNTSERYILTGEEVAPEMNLPTWELIKTIAHLQPKEQEELAYIASKWANADEPTRIVIKKILDA